MSDNAMDSIIMRMLKISYKESAKRGPDCPSDEKLADYINYAVGDNPLDEDIIKHITGCDFCFSKVASAISTLKNFDKRLTDKKDISDSIQKAKSIPRLYPKAKKTILRRNKYLLITATFFTLSFIFKRYFAQFLVAAMIFGFKWVMDTGGSKALIMIYDAWQHKKESKGEGDKRTFLFKNR